MITGTASVAVNAGGTAELVNLDVLGTRPHRTLPPIIEEALGEAQVGVYLASHVDGEASLLESIARIVRDCQELPGQHLFQYEAEDGIRAVTSEDVNGYLREISGDADISAKDFRTWAGTLLAARALWALRDFESIAQARRNIVQAVAESHGGSVSFEPGESGGARFMVRLPAVDAEPEPVVAEVVEARVITDIPPGVRARWHVDDDGLIGDVGAAVDNRSH